MKAVQHQHESAMGYRSVANESENKQTVTNIIDQRPEAAAQQEIQMMADARAVNSAQPPIQMKGGYIPGNKHSNYNSLGSNVCTAGAGFTETQKGNIYDKNEERGSSSSKYKAPMIDDYDDEMLVRNLSYVGTVDHIYPASKGGMNAYDNAQVIDVNKNISVGNDYPKHGFNGTEIYIGHNVTADTGMNQKTIAKGTRFDVSGNGSTATIDMSSKLPDNGNWQDPSKVTMAQAKNWEILPTNIPNPL